MSTPVSPTPITWGPPWPWTSPHDPQDLSKRVPLRSPPHQTCSNLFTVAHTSLGKRAVGIRLKGLHFGSVLLKIRYMRFDIILVISKSITSIQKCSEVVSLGSVLGRAHVLGVYGSKPILSSTILAH